MPKDLPRDGGWVAEWVDGFGSEPLYIFSALF